MRFDGVFSIKAEYRGRQGRNEAVRITLSNPFTSKCGIDCSSLQTDSQACKRLDDLIFVATSWKSLDVSARGLITG